jgi:hypothetical protein
MSGANIHDIDDTLGGRYKVKAYIGAGGMQEVYVLISTES